MSSSIVPEQSALRGRSLLMHITHVTGIGVVIGAAIAVAGWLVWGGVGWPYAILAMSFLFGWSSIDQPGLTVRGSSSTDGV